MTIEDVERFKKSVTPTPITFLERLSCFIFGGFAGMMMCVLLSLLYNKFISSFSFGLTAILVVLVFSLTLATVSAIYPRKMSKFLFPFTFFSPFGANT